MTTSYIPLPQKLRKNGYSYTLYLRTDFEAIYAQWYGNELISYEVFKIKRIPDKTVKGKLIKAHKKFLKEKDFGYTAWNYTNIDGANKKYNE